MTATGPTGPMRYSNRCPPVRSWRSSPPCHLSPRPARARRRRASSSAPTRPVQPSQAAVSSPRPCPEIPAIAPVVPWWADRVFYEVFVRSFADSDGDGIGDLRGLTQRLDYLNDGDPATTDDLGVTALWLMPVAESPSYHGYDVVDYRAVESDYGTADDFKALVEAADERGIAIVVDFVINHSSRDHPWFQEARTRGSEHEDWYVWADERPARRGVGRKPCLAPRRGSLLLRLLLGGHAGPQPREPGGHGRARLDRRVLARRDGRRRLPDRCRAPPDRGRPAAGEHRRDLRLAGRLPGPAEDGRTRKRSSSARSGTPPRCRRGTSRTGPSI